MSLFIDHIVINVRNIQETKNFYTNFLGEPIEREDDQVVYKIGDTKLFLALPQKEWSANDKDSSGLNHLAFGVRTLEELKEFENSLNLGGIKNSGIQIYKHGNREFIWFDDTNGIRLEFYLRN